MYADFLRIVLEILNTVITAGLPQNPELVYALLHRQEVFAPFQARCWFQALLRVPRQHRASYNCECGEETCSSPCELYCAVVVSQLSEGWRPEHVLTSTKRPRSTLRLYAGFREP